MCTQDISYPPFLSTLHRIGSYLCDRQPFVLSSSSYSHITDVSSGVPQGSHFRPLLFILTMFVVMLSFLDVYCMRIANDLKLYHTVMSLQDSVNLQHEANSVIKNYKSLCSGKC